MNTLTELEMIMAERAIIRLIYRFAMLNDAGEHEALANLFTEDGVFARPSQPDEPVRGRAALAAHFRDRPRRVTRHLMTNVVVSIENRDRASAHSCVTLFARFPSGPEAAAVSVLSGDFRDLFLKVDNTWFLAERHGSIAIQGKLS